MLDVDWQIGSKVGVAWAEKIVRAPCIFGPDLVFSTAGHFGPVHLLRRQSIHSCNRAERNRDLKVVSDPPTMPSTFAFSRIPFIIIAELGALRLATVSLPHTGAAGAVAQRPSHIAPRPGGTTSESRIAS